MKRGFLQKVRPVGFSLVAMLLAVVGAVAGALIATRIPTPQTATP